MKKKILFILVLMTLILAQSTYSYWASDINGSIVNTNTQITIGSWTFTEPFDENTDYSVGDEFSFGGVIWLITGDWFDESRFLRNNGTLNFNYIRPYGPVEEDTNEWRSYNTYYEGDIVIYNEFWWVARHEGANSAEPGTDTTAWNRISEEWFIYNTYIIDDIVLYNGQHWKALQENRNKLPSQYIWAWELVD